MLVGEIDFLGEKGLLLLRARRRHVLRSGTFVHRELSMLDLVVRLVGIYFFVFFLILVIHIRGERQETRLASCGGVSASRLIKSLHGTDGRVTTQGSYRHKRTFRNRSRVAVKVSISIVEHVLDGLGTGIGTGLHGTERGKLALS